LISKNFLGVL